MRLCLRVHPGGGQGIAPARRPGACGRYAPVAALLMPRCRRCPADCSARPRHRAGASGRQGLAGGVCRLRRIQAGACPEECCRPRGAAAPLRVRCSVCRGCRIAQSSVTSRGATRGRISSEMRMQSPSSPRIFPATPPGTPVRRRDGAACGVFRGFRVRCSGSLPISRSRMRRSVRWCGSASERATADRLPSVEGFIRLPWDSCTPAAARSSTHRPPWRTSQNTGAGKGALDEGEQPQKKVFRGIPRKIRSHWYSGGWISFGSPPLKCCWIFP